MKHEYAGIEIDIGYWVEFLDVYAAVPVFHRDGTYEQGPGYWRTKTACGRTKYEEEMLEGSRVVTRNYVCATLRAAHAVKFGRPCTKCWPQLRSQRSLFAPPRPNPRAEQETLA